MSLHKARSANKSTSTEFISQFISYSCSLTRFNLTLIVHFIKYVFYHRKSECFAKCNRHKECAERKIKASIASEIKGVGGGKTRRQ